MWFEGSVTGRRREPGSCGGAAATCSKRLFILALSLDCLSMPQTHPCRMNCTNQVTLAVDATYYVVLIWYAFLFP